MTGYFKQDLDEMIGSNNEEGRVVYRLLGAVIGGLGREIGVSKMRKIIRFIAENDRFWNVFEGVEGKEKYIGEVSEAIGSTQNPWIVITAKKNTFDKVEIDEVIYTQDVLRLKKSKKYRQKRKTKKKESK